jgi:hypothetical protein
MLQGSPWALLPISLALMALRLSVPPSDPH